MNIIESILTKNPCYAAGRKITVKGLMLHSVGCNQPKAEVFVKRWNDPDHSRACVHAFIDGNTGDVWQCLPWNHRGWHGGGTSNNTHIGVEMCEPACIKYTSGSKFTCSDLETAQTVVKRTYDAAVELFAYLCKEYGLNPLTDIISHKEGYQRGVASNHGDPEHLWKGLNMPYTMDAFRKAVNALLTGADDAPKEEPMQEVKPVVGASTEPYRVRVLIDNLRIRTGPGTNYPKTGKYTGKGVFTIVETKGTWGKLKSGAGWISLECVKKL